MSSPEIAQPNSATIDRRHDLDALRAIAMLLGIALHAAIAFIPGPTGWPVQDSQSHPAFGLFIQIACAIAVLPETSAQEKKKEPPAPEKSIFPDKNLEKAVRKAVRGNRCVPTDRHRVILSDHRGPR